MSHALWPPQTTIAAGDIKCSSVENVCLSICMCHFHIFFLSGLSSHRSISCGVTSVTVRCNVHVCVFVQFPVSLKTKCCEVECYTFCLFHYLSLIQLLLNLFDFSSLVLIPEKQRFWDVYVWADFIICVESCSKAH